MFFFRWSKICHWHLQVWKPDFWEYVCLLFAEVPGLSFVSTSEVLQLPLVQLLIAMIPGKSWPRLYTRRSCMPRMQKSGGSSTNLFCKGCSGRCGIVVYRKYAWTSSVSVQKEDEGRTSAWGCLHKFRRLAPLAESCNPSQLVFHVQGFQCRRGTPEEWRWPEPLLLEKLNDVAWCRSFQRHFQHVSCLGLRFVLLLRILKKADLQWLGLGQGTLDLPKVARKTSTTNQNFMFGSFQT